MTPLAALLAATLSLASVDRLGMADRLFNRGAYADARVEYAALKGDAAVAQEELLYRLAECDRALGRADDARRAYAELAANYPTSRHADRARLMSALLGPAEERAGALRALDSDRVETGVRTAALYNLGMLTGDAEAFARCAELAPKGRYAPYARLRGAAILARAEKPEDRRRAVAMLVEIAFDNAEANRPFAAEALYLAASSSYTEKSYDEAARLFQRYLKTYPGGARTADATRALAWCLYRTGHYADVQALCGAGRDDDAAYLAAAAAYAAGDLAEAGRRYRLYLEEHQQGRYRRAAELPLARVAFAEAQKARDAARSVEAARRAAALSKKPVDRLRLAWACEKAGRAEEAEREYLAGARDFPGGPEAAEAMYRKAMADLRAEQWAAADLALKEALAGKLDARRRDTARYWRGVAAIRQDHVEEGAALLKEALAGNLTLDQKREARIILADTDWNAGRLEDAKKAYAALLAEGAAERMGAAKLLAVGKAVGGEGAKTCARALAKSASAEWRQSGWALLGETEEAAGSFAAATDAYRKALDEKCATEALPRVAWRLGVLESKGGDLKAAEATLKRAVRLNARNAAARAELYLRLAEVAEALRDTRGARAYATVVTTLFEGSPFAKDAAALLARHPETEETP